MSWIQTCLLAATLALLVQSQVVGIDFGSEFWKAALVSPGKSMTIVENTRSGRKSINAISFEKGIRYFEEDSWAKRLKRPQNAYYNFREKLQALEAFDHLEGFSKVNETFVAEIENKQISVEQMVAMIFKKIKDYASRQAKYEVPDAVITVPSNWGFKARTAVANAAKIAGMSTLAIINENSAAALQYAMTRNDTEPFHLMIFNLGSRSLQISVFKLFGYQPEGGKNIESIEALSHITIDNIGGLSIDRILTETLASSFKAKHKLDPLENKKSEAKLLEKCAEIKETLSANKDAPAYIEGLIDGIDLSLELQRQIIENAPQWKNIASHLAAALEKANVEKDTIDAVQLIGGAVRIPIVAKTVKDYFSEKTDVGAHINGDESMALGSSFYAANLSRVFRVRQINFYDGHPEKVKYVVSSLENGVIQQGVLFERHHSHGSTYLLELDIPISDLKVSLFYGDNLFRQFSTINLTQWQSSVHALTSNKSRLEGQPKLMLLFEMSSVTIVQNKDAYVNFTLNTTEIKEITEKVPIEEEEAEDDKPKDGQNPSKDKDEAKQQSEIKEQGESKAENKTKKYKSVKKNETSYKISQKRTTIKTNSIKNDYALYDKEKVSLLQQTLTAFQKYEKEGQEASKARNDLGDMVNALMDGMESQAMIQFSTDAERQNLKEVTQSVKDWSEQYISDANKTELEKQMSLLFKAYDPIHNRSTEYRDRQSYINKTAELLGQIYHKAQGLVNTNPWVEEEAQKFMEKINATYVEIESKLKAQSELPLNSEPALYNHELRTIAENIREEFSKLKATKKPKGRNSSKGRNAEESKEAKDSSFGQEKENTPEGQDSEVPETTEL